jgi:hypothetical protein
MSTNPQKFDFSELTENIQEQVISNLMESYNLSIIEAYNLIDEKLLLFTNEGKEFTAKQKAAFIVSKALADNENLDFACDSVILYAKTDEEDEFITNEIIALWDTSNENY